MEPTYISNMKEMFLDSDFEVLSKKVCPVPHRFTDDGAPFVAEDDHGNRYRYCDLLPAFTAESSDWHLAADWIGVRPMPEWED